MKTSNITASNQLFLTNPLLLYWRFEVVYTFDTGTSTSAVDFLINQPPYNGSCSIAPRNGTTSTAFTVSCIDWLDDIEDYALYGTIRHLDLSISGSISRLHLRHRQPMDDRLQSTDHLPSSIAGWH